MNLTHKPIEISDGSDRCRVGRSQKLRKKPLSITLAEMPIVIDPTKSAKVATLEARYTQRHTLLSKKNMGQT